MNSGLKRKSIERTHFWVPWIQLTKLVLCLPIALSSGFGYILYKKTVSPDFFSVVGAMLLLTGGAACLNSIQERKIDSRFTRTKLRPLVIGTISLKQAAACCILLFSLSLVLLYRLGTDLIPFFLALSGAALYNGFYTPLKLRSSLALIIGGFSGAVPPLIGWTAAGGSALDIRILMVAVLFFLWQIPHFFMILLKHREEYRKQHASSLVAKLPTATVHRVTAVWVCSYLVVSLALTFLPDFLTLAARFIVMISALMQSLGIIWYLYRPGTIDYSFGFKCINGLFFANMLLVSIAELISG